MNIEKSLEHFKWKFQNSWKPTKKDIEAFNSIIDYKEMQESLSLTPNESLAKLFIYTFMKKCDYHNYSSNHALNDIEDILKKDLYYWVKRLHLALPIMQINALGYKQFELPKDFNNITELENRNKQVFDKYEAEIVKALGTVTSEQQLIKWLNNKINLIIKNYD